MRRFELRPWHCLVFAALAVAVASVARAAFAPVLGARLPFATYHLAIFAGAWFCGYRTGLLATLLSAFAALVLFVLPNQSVDAALAVDLISLGFNAVLGVAIAAASGALRSSRDAHELQRNWYASTLANVGDGVIATDAASRVTYMNPVAAHLCGLEPRAALGRPIGSVFHVVEEEREAGADPLGHDGSIEHPELVAADGIRRPIWMSTQPIRSGDGPPVGSVIVFRELGPARLAAQALERSENRFRALFDSGLLGVCFADYAGNVRQPNTALLELLGWTREQFEREGLSWAQVTPPEYELLDEGALNAVRASGSCPPYEKECVRRDGRRLWITVGISAFDQNEIVVFALDVSARKASEANLRDQRRLLRVIIDRVPAFIAYVDRSGAWRLHNRYLEQWFPGASVDGALLAVLAGTAPGGSDRLADALGGRVVEFEQTLIDRDGGRRVLEVTYRPDGDSGAVEGVVVHVYDVTERRAAADALRRSEAQHRALAENVPHMVWIADARGAITYVNRRWVEYTGVPADGDWRSAVHRDDLERGLHAWQYALDNGEELNLELRYRQALDGEYRWHLVRAVPIRDANERIARWYGTATDIEDRKRAQSTLENSARRMNEFLAVLSHELRNPLTAITMAGHLLGQPALEPARLEASRATILRQSGQLQRMVDDLLDVARITQGTIDLKLDTIDLRALLRGVVEDLAPRGAAQSVRVVLVDGEPVVLRADAARVQQAVENLIGNALKASPADSAVEVSIATGRSPDELAIVVRDQGHGIAPDMLQTIFDPFVRGRGGPPGGLGLGLAIVRRLAQLHGGEVEAQSGGIGYGATFRLYLPRGEHGALHTTAPSRQPGQEIFGRVLVIDDERDSAEALRAYLQLHGHEVAVAYDGANGLDIQKSWRPDVVICDLGLPEPLIGYRVAEVIHSREAQAPFLIAFSGYGRTSDIERCRRAGFDAHILKPATPSVVAGRVQEGLRRRSARNEPAPRNEA